jgi:hypothetical protein
MRQEKMILPLGTKRKHMHYHRVSLLYYQHTPGSHDAGLADEWAMQDAGPAYQGLWLHELTERVQFRSPTVL